MSVWTCCWDCNSLAPRWLGRRRFLPMRAWKRDGYPEFGYWMWTGEVDIECNSDWVPHGLNGECLHTRRLGEYNALQMTGQGYKELVHRQLYQDLAGMQLPPKVEIHHEKRTCRPSQQGHTGSCADKKRVLSWDCAWVERLTDLQATHCATTTHHLLAFLGLSFLGCFPYYTGVSTIPASLPSVRSRLGTFLRICWKPVRRLCGVGQPSWVRLQSLRMSSAKRGATKLRRLSPRSNSACPISVLLFCSAHCRTALNSRGLKTQPCRTPPVTEKLRLFPHSPMAVLSSIIEGWSADVFPVFCLVENHVVPRVVSTPKSHPHVQGSDMPEKLSDRMSEEMAERMSQDMSDKMLE